MYNHRRTSWLTKIDSQISAYDFSMYIKIAFRAIAQKKENQISYVFMICTRGHFCIQNNSFDPFALALYSLNNKSLNEPMRARYTK